MLNLSKKAGTLRGQVDTFMPSMPSVPSVADSASGAGSYLKGAASDMFMQASIGMQMYKADFKHAMGAPGRMASAMGQAYDDMSRSIYGYGQKLKALPGQMKQEFNAARFAAANPPEPPITGSQLELPFGPPPTPKPKPTFTEGAGGQMEMFGGPPSPGASNAAATGAGGTRVAANNSVTSGDYSGPFTAALASAHPMAMAAGMAAIGGVASYATGGNFMQGAVMGGVGGYAGVKGAGMGARYLGKNYAKGTMAGDVARSVRGYMMGAGGAPGTAAGTVNQRAAMLAGAGLSGMVFGGNRRSHKRGFNSRRGNGF